MISFDEAKRDDFQDFDVEIFATGETVSGFFTNARVDRATVPEGWHAYDLCEGEDGLFCTIEEKVVVNHGGTFLTQQEIDLGPNKYLELEEDFEYSF